MSTFVTLSPPGYASNRWSVAACANTAAGIANAPWITCRSASTAIRVERLASSGPRPAGTSTPRSSASPAPTRTDREQPQHVPLHHFPAAPERSDRSCLLEQVDLEGDTEADREVRQREQAHDRERGAPRRRRGSGTPGRRVPPRRVNAGSSACERADMFALSEARCRRRIVADQPTSEKRSAIAASMTTAKSGPPPASTPTRPPRGIDLVGEGRVVEQDCGHDRPPGPAALGPTASGSIDSRGCSRISRTAARSMSLTPGRSGAGLDSPSGSVTRARDARKWRPRYAGSTRSRIAR